MTTSEVDRSCPTPCLVCSLAMGGPKAKRTASETDLTGKPELPGKEEAADQKPGQAEEEAENQAEPKAKAKAKAKAKGKPKAKAEVKAKPSKNKGKDEGEDEDSKKPPTGEEDSKKKGNSKKLANVTKKWSQRVLDTGDKEEQEASQKEDEGEANEQETRDYGKARKMARMLKSGNVPDDIRRLYDSANQQANPRLFKTELINRLFQVNKKLGWTWYFFLGPTLTWHDCCFE